VRKPVTGSHSGTGWWLVQRISALVMLVVGTILFAVFWYAAPFDYPGWRAAFENSGIKLLVWLLVASLCLHAWIGLRDVLMDYVKPIVVRLLLNLLFTLTLSVSAIWVTSILWGTHG
jgi:succinate dehydrogenase / fumarate reductase membrane anchor subunit